MQTTTLNDSMMSDFFQVNGYTNMDGSLIPITQITKMPIYKQKIIDKMKEQQALSVSPITKMPNYKQEIIDKMKEQEALENPPLEGNSTDNNNQKTNYLLIGIGAILLVGVTTLIVKKS